MPSTWMLLPLAADGARRSPLQISKVSGVIRGLGVGAGVAEVAYSRRARQQLVKGAGVEVLRNGQRIGYGQLVEVGEKWPGGLRAAWASPQAVLTRGLAAPNPAAAGSAQAPAATWTRTGQASTVMTALLAEQLGPGAHPDWRVPGLIVGPDPQVGADVSVSIRYGSPDLLAELRAISAASGADLGVTITPTAGGGLLAQVVAPVESAGTARFSTALRNLTSFELIEKAPTKTHALVEDETGTPSAATAATTDPISLAWGIKAWSYKTAAGGTDAKPLGEQAADEAASGPATVSLACTLRDTARLAFGSGWDVWHRVRVDVGRPGEPTIPVVDVVREVAFEYGPDGEAITPAIGTADASALPTLPDRATLTRIAARLAGLERSN